MLEVETLETPMNGRPIGLSLHMPLLASLAPNNTRNLAGPVVVERARHCSGL